MATRYIIGKGELLTYPIEPPPIKPNKVHPYTFDEAKAAVLPQIARTVMAFRDLPSGACPDNLVVAKLVLHPSYVAKSYFPTEMLRDVGLISVGSKTVRIKPRKSIKPKGPVLYDTTELFIAGAKEKFGDFTEYVNALPSNTKQAIQFAEIEMFDPMTAIDRVKTGEPAEGYFEVGLHLLPDEPTNYIQEPFVIFAQQQGFTVFAELSFQAGRLLFMPIQGDVAKLDTLAQFSMLRLVRPMPKIRGFVPTLRSTLGLSFTLPASEPLSREPKVAILDGGLPNNHALARYVGRYFLTDETAQDVPDYLDHGLGVTSAFLFGPITPGQEATRPYSYVDHHRILDSKVDHEDPLELYRTLGHIEEILLSRQYQFINLSLGPNLPCEDNDVHAWTSVIDTLLSDGETMMTVAVGNNGDRDAELGFDRIQVPSDSVNALSVGATDSQSNAWSRASYSARGPGRSPGRRKPDVVAFGGSSKDYFHVAASGPTPQVVPNLGTSFASPLALRSAAGICAILGHDVHPLTVKALLVHSCQNIDEFHCHDVGWGKVPNDLAEIITCSDGVARIIYQGTLTPGKYLRAPVPLPSIVIPGKVELSATFCYASPVDPQDASAYTKAGLDIKFRPHVDKKEDGAKNPKTSTFFPASEWRTEQEQRADLGKWETVLHGSKNMLGSSLKGATFDIHYNARSAASNAYRDASLIRYALILTLKAPKHTALYDDILAAHAKLKALESRLSVPLHV